ALIFSQDQDLSEVADEIRLIADIQKRWIKVASAFPVSPVPHNKRGINGTDWIRIDRATYDACIDTRDYRPKTKAKPLHESNHSNNRSTSGGGAAASADNCRSEGAAGGGCRA